MQGSHNAVVVWFPLHDLGAEHRISKDLFRSQATCQDSS